MAVGEGHVFPGFLTTVLTQLSFQSQRLLFSHALAEVRGENKPVRKFASTGYRFRNRHQVMSPTLSLVTIEPPGQDNPIMSVKYCRKWFSCSKRLLLGFSHYEKHQVCKYGMKIGLID